MPWLQDLQVKRCLDAIQKPMIILLESISDNVPVLILKYNILSITDETLHGWWPLFLFNHLDLRFQIISGVSHWFEFEFSITLYNQFEILLPNFYVIQHLWEVVETSTVQKSLTEWIEFNEPRWVQFGMNYYKFGIVG